MMRFTKTVIYWQFLIIWVSDEEKAVNTTTLGVILLLAVLFLIVMYIVFKIQELKIKRLEQANKHLLEKFMELLEVVNETTDLEITVVENGEKYKMRK